jgi:preprotein translocase subunit SecG
LNQIGVSLVTLPLFAAIGQTLFGILLCLIAIFLILLVLVQRGRGGGLAGALGGMGGSSAFGAKAGDVFTRITIGAATVWILLCIAAARWGSSTDSRLDVRGPAAGAPPGVASEIEAAKAPADKGSAADAAAAPTAPASDAASTPAAPAAASEAAPATPGQSTEK